METVKKADRLPGKEYPHQKQTHTPVSFGGRDLFPSEAKQLIQEWSAQQAEANHVETLEEANDFEIPGFEMEEDEDFFQNLTVYEMHEQMEEIQKQSPPEIDPANDVSGRENENLDLSHDQSAPDEQTRSEPQGD